MPPLTGEVPSVCEAEGSQHRTDGKRAGADALVGPQRDRETRQGEKGTMPLISHGFAATAVSLRLGHAAALTCHRHVIHSRGAASLPRRGKPLDALSARRFSIA